MQCKIVKYYSKADVHYLELVLSSSFSTLNFYLKFNGNFQMHLIFSSIIF